MALSDPAIAQDIFPLPNFSSTPVILLKKDSRCFNDFIFLLTVPLTSFSFLPLKTKTKSFSFNVPSKHLLKIL